MKVAANRDTLHHLIDRLPGLRVGEYRVIFRTIEDGLEVLTVGHRSDVYR
jgi:hypothetical protein